VKEGREYVVGRSRKKVEQGVEERVRIGWWGGGGRWKESRKIGSETCEKCEGKVKERGEYGVGKSKKGEEREWGR
jgi:hypothetical protein